MCERRKVLEYLVKESPVQGYHVGEMGERFIGRTDVEHVLLGDAGHLCYLPAAQIRHFLLMLLHAGQRLQAGEDCK